MLAWAQQCPEAVGSCWGRVSTSRASPKPSLARNLSRPWQCHRSKARYYLVLLTRHCLGCFSSLRGFSVLSAWYHVSCVRRQGLPCHCQVHGFCCRASHQLHASRSQRCVMEASVPSSIASDEIQVGMGAIVNAGSPALENV